MANLLDLRFADDVLIFGGSSSEVSKLLDGLVAEFLAVGLTLNSGKTVVLTSEAQAPKAWVGIPAPSDLGFDSRGHYRSEHGERHCRCILESPPCPRPSIEIRAADAPSQSEIEYAWDVARVELVQQVGTCAHRQL